MFKILYGDSNPFEGIAPTPMVSRSISPVFYAKKHGEIESYSLNGVITGARCFNDNEFSGLWSGANKLLSNWSKPFQRFRITEDLGDASGVLFSNGYAIIRSVDFEEGGYAGILPFTVNLDVFKEGSFGNYGIMNPSQEISFNEEPNGDVNISKNTSAAGFNTDLGALENATNFVHSITGLSHIVTPLFISQSGLSSAILVSLNKKVNRLTGQYEVSEEWVYNRYGNKGSRSINERTVSIDSGVNGSQVTVNGKLKGGIGESFTSLRNDFNNIDIFGIADAAYSENSSGDLYVKPLSKQISEDSLDRSIDFTFVYSDRLMSDPYLEDSISITKDRLANKTCVNSSVTIKSTDTCPATRWTKVKNYSDSFSIINWTKSRLLSLGYNINLPNKPSSSSLSYNEQNGTITVSAGICDKKIAIPSYFDDFNYTVSIVPAMPTFIPFQGIDCGGAITVQKLIGLKRRTLSIQGNGVISSCASFEQAKASLLAYVNSLKFTYLQPNDVFLTQHNIQQGTGELKNKITFSFSWNEAATSTIFSNEQLHASLS
jgi:hypothetical protein